MSSLVLIGSGETAPTMVKTHRRIMDPLGLSPGRPAVFLDTPFGFQVNADDLTARTERYFEASVGTPVTAARWRSREQPAAQRERALSLLARAGWAFAGPGSPSYALRHWVGTAVPAALADVARRGGALVFGSAAAAAVGARTVPVYEIYKAGADPAWLPGLDLLGELTGLRAAVVPHFDNAEGGHYDTRFCYLGEQRLAALEAQLPPEVGVLGIDEHTAVVLDLTAGTAEVLGSGGLTVRHAGRQQRLAAGCVLPVSRLAALLDDPGQGSSAAPAGQGQRADRSAADAAGPAPAEPAPATDLAGVTRALTARFRAAAQQQDAEGCAGAALDLERAIVDWGTDSLQSDHGDRARAALRTMIVDLADLAGAGPGDLRRLLGPFVEALLELRRRARDDRDYATSDLVRNRLTAAGVQVRDTPEGSEWILEGVR